MFIFFSSTDCLCAQSIEHFVVATVKETRNLLSVLLAWYFIAPATHFSIKFQPASCVYHALRLWYTTHALAASGRGGRWRKRMEKILPTRFVIEINEICTSIIWIWLRTSRMWSRALKPLFGNSSS